MENLTNKWQELELWLKQNWPYRRGTARYNGSKKEFEVSLNSETINPLITINKYTITNPNSQWPKTFYSFNISLNPSHIFSVIDRKLTFTNEVIDSTIPLKCYWFEQSQGMSLRMQQGFTFMNYHEIGTNEALVVKKILEKINRKKLKKNSDLSDVTIKPEDLTNCLSDDELLLICSKLDFMGLDFFDVSAIELLREAKKVGVLEIAMKLINYVQN